jgi:hypothetical protein
MKLAVWWGNRRNVKEARKWHRAKVNQNLVMPKMMPKMMDYRSLLIETAQNKTQNTFITT